jgi:hypothetical protein
MSTAIGRGCVSNSNGNAITPMPSSTTAPIKRRRARTRACSACSPVITFADAAAGVAPALSRLVKMSNSPMRGVLVRRLARWPLHFQPESPV